MSDHARMPAPGPWLKNMPPGGAVILRDLDAKRLELLAIRIIPLAHALGLKVLIAGDVRLALKLNADGVHLCEHLVRRNALRLRPQKANFLITAAAHNRIALQRATRIGAQAILLSPVFTTNSHPGAKSLGITRFCALARHSKLAIIALGGINSATIKRLRSSPAYGIAAIDLWTQTA
ncbi:MAG: thiamine phosphate synthase [Magnetovibrio sp.]|nr:thiamine phosphate synthase [Magnetovibrio sp.]